MIRLVPDSAEPLPRSKQKPVSHSSKPSIAVLAFTNMSGDLEQEYLSDGNADDIIAGPSRGRSFFVIARNSSFTYKGRPVDIRQVAKGAWRTLRSGRWGAAQCGAAACDGSAC